MASRSNPMLLGNFPPYRISRNLNEVSAYLANASSFISVGGRPCNDLKYTIISVPAGEEALLFGGQPPRGTANNTSVPVLPGNFPPYRITRNLNEVSAYLANASSFISVGGRPCNDLKYTIMAMPAGEENLLFGGNQGPQETAAERTAFLDAVGDARRAYYKGQLSNDPYLNQSSS